MADPFLDRKPMKLPKNGSDVICFFVLVFVLHFMTVLAAAFCTACRRLICFRGSQALTKSDRQQCCLQLCR